MKNIELESVLNELLKPEQIKDYAPNGLQVEGRSSIQKIITGVSATQALIDVAIEKKADAILTHHGYFWKGEHQALVGMKGRRIKSLMQHDINLFAYHLPLDVHPSLGNNALLAKKLGIEVRGGLEAKTPSIAMHGRLLEPISAEELAHKIAIRLNRKPLHILAGEPNRMVETIGWCSGGGQDYLELAANFGLDAFISGEISERTTHIAKEMGIDYYSAGHHATERYGIQALGDYLANKYGFDVEFIDIDNPV